MTAAEQLDKKTVLHFIEMEEGHYDVVVEFPEGEEDVELACVYDKDWGEWLVRSAAQFHGIAVEVDYETK